MDASRALRLVEARLGRGPQDALEAAVVLEAWAGVPAQRALDTGRALMTKRPHAAAPSATRPPVASRPPRMAVEGAALVITVLAIASWAGPLSEVLGGRMVSRALVIALPVTLALQSALRARHLGRPSGLKGLLHRRGALAAAAAALVAVPAAVLGEAGALAGLLVVTWTGGSILLRRGWTLPYALTIAAATLAMAGGAPPLAVVAATAVVTLVICALALAPPRGEEAPTVPGRWGRTVGAAITGAGVGLLIVGDPSVAWADGGVAALALLPSAAGGLWAGHHLWRLVSVFPRALSGVPAEPGAQAWAREPVVTLLGAAARLAALTMVGSAALLAWAPWVGAGVLAGFGVVALASLLIGLLESLGRPAAAAVGVAGGVVGELAVRTATETPFAGAALVAGGGLALLIMLPVAAVLLSRPARTLATGLWIT
jgi:hypothetical protein